MGHDYKGFTSVKTGNHLKSVVMMDLVLSNSDVIGSCFGSGLWWTGESRYSLSRLRDWTMNASSQKQKNSSPSDENTDSGGSSNSQHTWVSHFISNSETTCVSISFLQPFHCVAAVKWHRSRLFVENNTPHFRWMMVHIHPVAYDFLSLSAGSGINSPGTRGPSICTTAQGKRSVWGHPRKQ